MDSKLGSQAKVTSLLNTFDQVQLNYRLLCSAHSILSKKTPKVGFPWTWNFAANENFKESRIGLCKSIEFQLLTLLIVSLRLKISGLRYKLPLFILYKIKFTNRYYWLEWDRNRILVIQTVPKTSSGGTKKQYSFSFSRGTLFLNSKTLECDIKSRRRKINCEKIKCRSMR